MTLFVQCDKSLLISSPILVGTREAGEGWKLFTMLGLWKSKSGLEDDAIRCIGP
jgi:hypothetical protein